MAITPFRRSSWLSIIFIVLTLTLYLFLFRPDSLPKPNLNYDDSRSLTKLTSSQPVTSINLHSSADGHLYFLDNPSNQPSPEIQHPIFSLIKNATAKWKYKIDNQSLNLSSGVAEYYQRYHRHPPRGFDEWWDWATEKGVQLLDEYDSIMKAIEPFFALPPHIFRQRVQDLLNDRTKWKESIFVISIKAGKVELYGRQAHNGPRPKELLELLEGIAYRLPDVELPISSMDLPTITVSAKNYERHIELARQSKYLPDSELSAIYDEPGLYGWPNTCPSGSRLRNKLDGHNYPMNYEPSSQSYIVDHVPAMNLCDHPELEQMIGFLSTTRPKVHPFFPLFSFTKTNGFSELPLTPVSQYYHGIGVDPLWHRKKFNKLIWRGSNTGILYNRDTNWRQSQRPRLVKLTNESKGKNITVRIVEPKTSKLSYFEANSSSLNSKYFDIGFSGQPLQCEVEDGTCEAVRSLYTFKDSVEPETMNHYKYIMDVDGNGWSGRFHKLMTTRSVILKSTIFPEWYVYADRIQPWYHYVPVRVDYQDLYDIMGFFTGDLEGRGAQDKEGEKIGAAGSIWAQTFWRKEDMQAYMYRIILVRFFFFFTFLSMWFRQD
ncbi:hypothetical protein CROQUDRAFT_43986 [Cronartium quercuum f. sp. fusiforme G11]|uniref:Glycosyl transferase CAP10 domain-containing protein n=1 Tax=Cronartium quercuum f. sp. fusiforme G11 TaxID=708437 RepID=A0A9P6NGU5_9BASI|nr:hypothetical protein CROQUDRAFT_43986 [Cronartium quercuum f. sp. fusiforme G11]